MNKALNILVNLSILAVPHFVMQAYQNRGYFAIGGEWLIVLIPLLVITLIGQVRLLWKECDK